MNANAVRAEDSRPPFRGLRKEAMMPQTKTTKRPKRKPTKTGAPEAARPDVAAEDAPAAAGGADPAAHEARVLAAIRGDGDREFRWGSFCSQAADELIRRIHAGRIKALAFCALDRRPVFQRMAKLGSLAELRRSFAALDPARPATTSGSILVLTPEALAERERKRGAPLQKTALADVVAAVEARLLNGPAAS